MKTPAVHFLTVVLLLAFVLPCPAQQGNNWYFGYKGGLNFNTNPPSHLTNGELSTLEGCSSISDQNGNLLFYTDGMVVYNKNHQPMPNGTGLKGDYSATQSAIIVQKPGSDNIYYIFTANSQGFNLWVGYHYSIVDINLDNGFGDITQKNVLLYAPCTERLAAVRHANGVDIWILTNEFESNNIKAYRIDCDGLDPIPVVSAAGLSLGGDITKAIGHFKVSPDGKILCQTITDQSIAPVNCFQLFQFDNGTGQVSNPIKIPTPGSNYGAEFSPNSTLLYISSSEAPTPRELFQYSVGNYDSTLIHDSRYTIATPSFSGTALQIGPDQRIYHAKLDSANLGVIINPDVQGPGCNYISQGISIGGKSAGGLPTFMGNYLVNRNAGISFTPDANCSGVNFQGLTTITGPVNWSWDFEDGNTSDMQNPGHVFPGTGNQFTVTLTVTPVSGCGKASAHTTINLIRPLITPDFSADYSCGSLGVKFLDRSRISIGNITSWSWDFGDGLVSNQQSPSHTYAGQGNYDVKLTVRYASGCVVENTLTKQISLESKPIADFSISTACAGKPLQFDDLSTIAPGTISRWYWNFGDGSNSVEQYPIHSFNTAGTYRIKQVAVSATGCISDTSYRNIEVNFKPVSDFTVANSCVTDPVAFSSTNSTVNNSTINQWYWNFGDDNTSAKGNPLHAFSGPGNYLVKLAVNSDKGCISDTLERSIEVEAKPVAVFTIENGCTSRSILPVNQSSTVFGTITAYYWIWEQSQTSNQFQPAIYFTQSGNYPVKMVAYSKNGCISDTATVLINIEEAPVVEFSFGNACVGKEIMFTNGTTGPVTSWNWNFGNGRVSALQAPTFTYNMYGDYTITLTTNTLNGCMTTATKKIFISRVIVNAGNDTIIASGQPLQLHASGALSFEWQPAAYLNDPAIASPIAMLPFDFTYRLQGITTEGCIGYDNINIKVFKDADIYVPTAFTPNNDGRNDIFKPIYAGIKDISYFSVYNRWGQIVFTTKDTGRGWDGTFGGLQQNTDVFVWMVKGVTYDGRLINKKGTTTLLR